MPGRCDPADIAYDEELAERVRDALAGEPGLSERRMFGGLGFLVDGHLAASASGQGGLMLRIDPARTESMLDEPHVRRCEMRGRELDGWLRVDVERLGTDEELRGWLDHGVGYARSLPARAPAG